MVTLSIVVQNSLAYILNTLKREEGQGFGEYSLIFALIVVVAATTLTPLGQAIRDEFTTVTALF
jgi:Flp pilus assembly pilin Flp